MSYTSMPRPEMGAFPPETPVGMCYVPFQKLGKIYEPDTALMQGTLFPDLDKPWIGSSGGMMRGADAYPAFMPMQMTQRSDQGEAPYRDSPYGRSYER